MRYIKLICVGKLKERFFADAVEEYRKRLSTYCKLEIEELAEQRLPEQPSQAEKNAALEREMLLIRQKIPKGAQIIAMCIEGKEFDSVELSKELERRALAGSAKFCFIVGGSFGLHENIKQEASLRMSMSRMTFPHHLARVMLLEQIYRAFKIAEGSKYHK